LKKSAWLSLPLTLGLFVASANPQSPGHGFPTPPQPLDTPTPGQAPSTPSRRIDLAQLQQQADDLARTAQTIPSDVANVRKGILPKDVIAKLKQIEKLSKRMRIELNP
jgi:hypothetical protein